MRFSVRGLLTTLLFALALVSALPAAPATASTSEEINALPVLDALNRNESPLSNAGKWSTLAWASSSSGHASGQDTTSGWGPYDAFSVVNGAYFNPASFGSTNGSAAAITMQTSPGISERYVSLWLDMANPGSTKSGYQLRWRQLSTANTYKVTLSKWSAGSETTLAELASTEILPGTTLAITDTGSTVTAWKGSGGSLSSFLSAADATYSSGYAGIEASGSNSRSLNFKAGAFPSTAERIAALPVLDALNRSESPLSNGGKWAALAWDTSTSSHNTGQDSSTGWGPYDAFSVVNGAYWTPSTYNDANGSVAAITMQTAPGIEERYVSLWLDMGTPTSGSRSGYQLRWKALAAANTYRLTLSKWAPPTGKESVLAELASTEIAPGTTLAITDNGSTVAAWKSSGGSLTSILSATDTTFSSGYAGIEASGSNSRSLNFKAGTLNPPPDTTISGGPIGIVTPSASFSFTSNPAGAGFECSLDGGSYSGCASPKTYQGLTEGTHTFRVRATNSAGADQTPAERSFQAVTAAKAVTKTAGLDNLERQEVPLATGKWSKTSWSGEIGGGWCCGSYRGYGSSGSTVAGAYWNPATFDDGGGTVLVSGKVGTGASFEGEYLALWLDMPSPGSARSGYEARFTGVNGSSANYKAELSKWVAGTRTVLASATGVSLPAGTTMALTETSGGGVSLWTGTSTLSPVLTAVDTVYASGYAGLEVNGPEGTIYDFRAGRIDLQAPDTTIQTGPSGVVSPQNVSFTFTSTEAGSSFECSIDAGAYAACSSPKSYPSLAIGPHTFRVRAVDAVGNQDATPALRSFEVAKPPVATTGAAVGVSTTEATLHGNVNPNGVATTYQFEYGATTAYGKTIPASAKSAGTGSQLVSVNEIVTGLAAKTTYHFRLKATNSAGTTLGSDQTFTTPEPAPVRVLVFGQAAEAPAGALVSPQQPLSVSAGAEGGQIKELQLRVDGTTDSVVTRAEALEEGGNESCFGGVCTLSYEYPSAFSAEVASGQHSFEVRAVDGVGNQASFTRQVPVDAEVPQLELTGSLIEANGAVTGSAATVIAHAADGSGTYASGLSSIAFYVDGVYQSGLSTDCSGGCPAEGNSSYEYTQQKWGVGPHELTVVVKDAAGNEDSESVMVNKQLAAVEPSCSTAQPTSVPVGTSASTTQATAALKAVLPAAVAPIPADPDEEGFEPTLTSGKSASEGTEAFLAEGGLVGGRVVRGSRRAFTVGQATCLVPMQTTGAESAPEVLPSSGTVVYANTAPETDTFLRNNGVGTTVIQSFRGPSAPSSLSWTVSLKSGQRLEVLANGAVAVVSSKGFDLPEAQVPSPPAGIDNPEKLADPSTVADAASYELRRANNEVEGAVEAVIPPALIIASNGAVQKVPMTVSGEKVSAAVPTGAKAMVVRTDSSPQPAAICAAAFEDDPANYVNGCSPEQDTDGERPYITDMDWAPDGSFVYTSVFDEMAYPWEFLREWNPAETFLYRANGSEVEELETPGFKVLGSPKVSPDGTKIAFNGCSLVSFKCGLVLTNAEGEEGNLVASIEGHLHESRIAFSRDGNRLLYENSWAKGADHDERQYFSVKLDGTGQKQLTNITLTNAFFVLEGWDTTGTLDMPLAVDPTSDTLVIGLNGYGFYSFHESQEKATEASMHRFLVWGVEPAFNPAGTKIAFASGGYGEEQGIRVMNADGSENHVVAHGPGYPSSEGEQVSQPVYSADGSQIAYIRDGVIYRVPASGGASTLVVDGNVSGAKSLAAAIAETDPELAEHLPAIEAAETAYLSNDSGSSAPGPVQEGLDVAESINKWEVEFCILNPIECAWFADDRKLALAARGALFTNRNQIDRSTRGNAFQHGFWTALMVRSARGDTEEVDNGLLYALHHESKPFSWDARQDIINDYVGYFWVAKTGLESWEEDGEIKFHFQNKLEFCQGLLPKGKNAIFIHGSNPWYWVSHHDYEFGRLIFRKLRSNQGAGTIVKSNGRHCAEVWAAIT